MSTDNPPALTWNGIPIQVSRYLPEDMAGFMVGVDHGGGPAQSGVTVAARSVDGQITSMANRVDPGGALTFASLMETMEQLRQPLPPQPLMAIMSPRWFVSISVNLHLVQTLSRRVRRTAGSMRHHYAAAVASVPAEYRALAQSEIGKVKARALARERRRGRVLRRAKHGRR